MSAIRPADPLAIGPETILGVSTSLKAARAGSERSASLALLAHALRVLADAGLDVALLDLRKTRVPPFDGRMPADCEDVGVRTASACVARAGGLLLAVPAYWSGVSGVFKNFVDVLCGPAYDLPQPATTPFGGKPTALLVVGADAQSARAGARDAPRILASTGARLVGAPVTVANPRAGLDDANELSRQLVLLDAELARAVHRREAAPCS